VLSGLMASDVIGILYFKLHSVQVNCSVPCRPITKSAYIYIYLVVLGLIMLSFF